MNNLYKYCGASGFQKEEILKTQFWSYVMARPGSICLKSPLNNLSIWQHCDVRQTSLILTEDSFLNQRIVFTPAK